MEPPVTAWRPVQRPIRISLVWYPTLPGAVKLAGLCPQGGPAASITSADRPAKLLLVGKP